ncbi:hypothetical protein OCGS_1056 [Oceaniovalibus guishaninsula JLT2003]|uniref:Capsular polysaccharide phosphotransferase SacB n=1 Tax=Oceaniovalibus guishaninsula JLT2003 TaxID=1231392 RepID=K2HBG2_9RHOB|nr:stealth conserved region 3 domain-containing protein [Oceaniovalibus guishaninsula]EKE44823.1 hypothetical protein OCGS_1056 [Oceaniovalibus guishaninsula JLT2003]
MSMTDDSLDPPLSFPARVVRLARSPRNFAKYRMRRWLDVDVPEPDREIHRIAVPLQASGDPLAILDSVDLGFVRRFDPDAAAADVMGASVEPALFAMRDACRANRQRLFLIDGKRTLPADETRIREMAQAHQFAVAVRGSGGAINSIRNVNVWRDEGAYLRCFAPRQVLPVMPGDSTVDVPVATELSRDFPVDAVYTWVNAADPDWQDLIAPYREATRPDPDRFAQLDELKYSLRSLASYAPWVRTIYIVSNCAPPAWLKAHRKIRWIRHEEIIPAEYLPTFNSHAIETFLHRIDGLSEQFIYLNDDFMLADHAHKAHFFDHRGRAISRLEPYGAVLKIPPLLDSGEAQEWQSAAMNGARMIEARFGTFPMRLHQHCPFALCRSDYAAMEDEFSDAIRTTRAARFRSHDDVSFTSFLYHHYVAENGRGVRSSAAVKIVRPTNHGHFRRDYWKSPIDFFCVNDGSGSALDPAYAAFKTKFLPEAFPLMAPWES